MLVKNLQTPGWMIMKGLSRPSNRFGWSRKTFRNHPNTEMDTETDVDDKRFCTDVFVYGR